MVDVTIAYAVMNRVAEQLAADMMEVDDDAEVGVVMQGPLFDDPDYESARISIELFENDPDDFDTWEWADEPVSDLLEIGQGMTWRRRFKIVTRVLLVSTMENRVAARKIASAVKARLEASLMKVDFGDLMVGGERVTGRVFNENIRSKLLQAGGPDNWDFELQTRFEVKTTKVYST
jgi:hypothetical protein